jgi:hypothetical protein
VKTKSSSIGLPGKFPVSRFRDDDLAVFLSGCKGLDHVLVFPFGLCVPLLDRGQTFDRLAFVSYYGPLRKAVDDDFGTTLVLGGKIDCDWYWKINIVICHHLVRA